jgi:hypothetical protein
MSHSKSFVTGLVLAGLLAAADITTPFTSDGEHPPMVIGLACAVLGLITAVGVARNWRATSRGWITAIIVTRLLAAVAAVPAFLVDGVPAGAVAAAGVGLAATLLVIALIAPGLRRPVLAHA